METFSAWLAICAGNSPVSGEFPARRPVTWNFDVFFYLCPNKLLSKQSWGWWFETPSRPLWRHRKDVGYSSWYKNLTRECSIIKSLIQYLWILRQKHPRHLYVCNWWSRNAYRLHAWTAFGNVSIVKETKNDINTRTAHIQKQSCVVVLICTLNQFSY